MCHDTAAADCSQNVAFDPIMRFVSSFKFMPEQIIPFFL